MNTNYNSLNQNNNSQTKPKKEIKQIVSNAKTKKKDPISKFVSNFFAGDFNDVKNYVLHDVIEPAIKKTIQDTITKGLESWMYGDSRPKGGSTYSNPSYKYHNLTNINNNTRRETHTVDDIIFESKGEAEAVLSQMVDVIADYESVSVADLYEMVGMSCDYTENNYGWTQLGSAYTQRVSGGYILRLPKAIALK